MEWWKSLFRKRALDAQLDSELRFHIEELTEANIAAGLAPDEARRRAVLEFGGREQIKEEIFRRHMSGEQGTFNADAYRRPWLFRSRLMCLATECRGRLNERWFLGRGSYGEGQMGHR